MVCRCRKSITSTPKPGASAVKAYPEDVQKCLDTGMNAHVSKPLYKDVVLETVERFIYKWIKTKTTVPYNRYGRFRWYRKMREW